MTTQVNSDKTIAIDAGLTRFIKGEAARLLEVFAAKLTRVEIHLSDIDSKRRGQRDIKCTIEARPAGAKPLIVSAQAAKVDLAVVAALGKLQRSLTTYFGKLGRKPVEMRAPVATAKKKTAAGKKVAKKKVAAKKPVAEEKAADQTGEKLPPGQAPKKRIYQARRKSWPAR